MFEEPRDHEVAPRLAAAAAMEADMAATVRQKRCERRICRPIIPPIERPGYPGIVERRQHQGRDADATHEPRRPAAIVVVFGAAKAITRGDEDVVVVPDAARAHDGGALGGRDDGALACRLDLHLIEDIAVIEAVGRAPPVAAGGAAAGP